MDKEPKISILMPVYNVEKYVAEAIHSILNQTYPDFELLLLDDCSTDQTPEIIRRFKDTRIRYHRNETNLGLAENLNVGIRLSFGEFIARMDGDDISLPERLKTQVDFLEAHPTVDLCSCGLQMFGVENMVWLRESDPEAVKITMMFYSPVLHATSVWRRKVFMQHNLYYNQDAFPAEDYDLWARAVFHCTLVNIPQVLYKYRIHGVQITKTDSRSEQKEEQIRAKYLENALPGLNANDRTKFAVLFIKKKGLDSKHIYNLKTIYEAIVKANVHDKFFNQVLLEKRLKRYYQNLIFDYIITNKFIWKNIFLFFDLRIKQLSKLIIRHKIIGELL